MSVTEGQAVFQSGLSLRQLGETPTPFLNCPPVLPVVSVRRTAIHRTKIIDVPAGNGMPYASVHPSRINHPPTANGGHPTDPIDDALYHQRFRHSFWHDRRIRTGQALQELYPIPIRHPDSEAQTKTRTDRFNRCGELTWVMRSVTDPSRYRLRVNACKDRFCEACAVERRHLIAQNVIRNLPDRRLIFVTLTLKSSRMPLRQQLTRIVSCFHKLRNRSKLKSFFPGGLYFIEVTRSDVSGLWHPHLHCLVDKPFIPHTLLKSQWHAITEDSFIVDIRQVPSTRYVVGYITKYAGKAIPSHIWTDPAAFREVIQAFERKRTFSTFGNWKSFDLTKKPADDDQWIDVGSLAAIIRNASAGQPDAMHVLAHLKRSSDHAVTYFDTS